MSSATSTEDPGLRPWQFFLLAGMLSATGVVLIVAGRSPASIIVLSLTVVAASFVALGAYRSLAPLVAPEAALAPLPVVGRARAALEREKALVLRSIKELEFDFAMKKVAQADFDDMSARLRARAIGLMRQLDEDGGYRAEIERELQTRIGVPRAKEVTLPVGPGFSPGVSPGISDSTTDADADNASPEGGASRSCPCGIANDEDAKFCKGCGAKLAAG